MYLKNTNLIVLFNKVTSYLNQSFHLSFMLPNITSAPAFEMYGPINVDCEHHKSPRLLYLIVMAKTVFSGCEVAQLEYLPYPIVKPLPPSSRSEASSFKLKFTTHIKHPPSAPGGLNIF